MIDLLKKLFFARNQVQKDELINMKNRNLEKIDSKEKIEIQILVEEINEYERINFPRYFFDTMNC